MSTRDAIISSRRTVEELTFRDIDDLPNDELDDLDEVEEIEVELAVLALTGTTVVDDGLVERAYERALDRAGIATSAEERIAALACIRDNIGCDRADVFRHLVSASPHASTTNSAAGGDEVATTDADDQASHAVSEFEAAFAELREREGVEAVPGAAVAIRELRASGVRVALISGFNSATTRAMLAELGWADLADVVLSSDDVPRGRPRPDLALTALLRCAGSAVERMIVVGDTVSDIESGLAAGAGVTIGVLTGSHDERSLADAGADAVIDSIADLPALLGLDRPIA
ncbi:HAD family hydrolase [Rathayibacter sp. KR2-224]|uniref:HAD family hydrolase n=1 Tax=Rathayibacter sp. KR2-224 TaxID=3400913 RepID=UPI003C06F1E5